MYIHYQVVHQLVLSKRLQKIGDILGNLPITKVTGTSPSLFFLYSPPPPLFLSLPTLSPFLSTLLPLSMSLCPLAHPLLSLSLSLSFPLSLQLPHSLSPSLPPSLLLFPPLSLPPPSLSPPAPNHHSSHWFCSIQDLDKIYLWDNQQ